MNIAQHANDILEAWRYNDRSGLGAALDSASNSWMALQPDSNLDTERSELLASIVEHLRELAHRDEMPAPEQRNGAAALLAHLSAGAGMQEISGSEVREHSAIKGYNLAQKAPK